MNDPELQLAQRKPEQYGYDARATRDMATVQFIPAKMPSEQWLVLSISPAAHSGSATLVGGAIDGTTGRIIDASSGKPVEPSALPRGVVQEGSWVATMRFGSAAGKRRGSYHWFDDLPTHVRKLSANDLYNPFSRGGEVLCRHNPQLQGSREFDSVSLLPEKWDVHARGVFEALRKDSELFSAPLSPSKQTHLQALVEGDNAILSAMAFRTLIEAGKIDRKALRANLTKAQGYRRAVFAYVALAHPKLLGEAALEEELTRVIEATRRVPDHRGIALALATTTLLHPESPASRSVGRKLLSHIRRHSNQISKAKKDPYLEQIFTVLQIL